MERFPHTRRPDPKGLTMSEKQKILETFENPYPNRDFLIQHVAPEFTSVCPKTGQPDFGTMTLEYIADEVCGERKSLKLYYQSFRNDGIFYEELINRILDDLVAVLSPRCMTLVGEFTPRGGMHSVITVDYLADEAE